jgi:hypothetical protein
MHCILSYNNGYIMIMWRPSCKVGGERGVGMIGESGSCL